MTDIKCGEFVVQGIKCIKCMDGSTEKYYVMEKGPTPRAGDYLLDTSGKKYQIAGGGLPRNPDENGMYQLKICFEDQNLELPKGIVLKREPEKWRQQIPNSRVIRIECVSTSIYMTGEINEPF
jgi:hypothetical protein